MKRISYIILLLLLVVSPSGATHRHRSYWNPILKGSYEAQLIQNQEIDGTGLDRIVDQDQLRFLEERGDLVPIVSKPYLVVSSLLKPTNRYCRPWTYQFLLDMSQGFFIEFHHPLKVNSAVRTIEEQHRLRRHNRNAAPEYGETASSHPAGTTVDIAKKGLTRKEHDWIVDYLKMFQDAGFIVAIEERHQACFHVQVFMVYNEL